VRGHGLPGEDGRVSVGVQVGRLAES
jgi:hypothetical protein